MKPRLPVNSAHGARGAPRAAGSDLAIPIVLPRGDPIIRSTGEIDGIDARGARARRTVGRQRDPPRLTGRMEPEPDPLAFRRDLDALIGALPADTVKDHPGSTCRPTSHRGSMPASPRAGRAGDVPRVRSDVAKALDIWPHSNAPLLALVRSAIPLPEGTRKRKSHSSPGSARPIHGRSVRTYTYTYAERHSVL